MNLHEIAIVPMIGIGVTKEKITTTFDGKWICINIYLLCVQIILIKHIK